MSEFLSIKATAKLVRKPDFALITLFTRSDGLLMSDATRAAEDRVRQAVTSLQKEFSRIEGIQTITTKMGEKDKRYRSDERSDIARPEVITLLLVKTPVDPALVVQILDVAIRSNLMIQSPLSSTYLESATSVVYCLADPFAGAPTVLAAIANARKRAEEIAPSLGKKIGGIISIPETNEYNLWSSEYHRSEIARFVGPHFCSTDPNGVDVIATVTVQFALT